MICRDAVLPDESVAQLSEQNQHIQFAGSATLGAIVADFGARGKLSER